jgi:DNA polymerase elongation subunit (family B)
MKFNRRGRFKGARIKGRMHLDLYPFVTHVLAPGIDSETLDLDSVAQEMLGKEKDDLSWSEMKQIWREKGDIEKFAEYALKDSELTYQLGEQISPQILELSKITGLIPFDTCRLTYGQLTENYLLREAYSRNMLSRNRPSQKKRSKRDREQAYTGGFVYTPEEGLYDNVAVFDFRSLYPTVMVAHNISPEMLGVEACEDEFIIDELDYSFCQDEQGFFPELVENLVSSRYSIKEKMKNMEEGSEKYSSLYSRQQAQKILANSFYGYLGYSGARWYSREAAEATTYLGRKYIAGIPERLRKPQHIWEENTFRIL